MPGHWLCPGRYLCIIFVWSKIHKGLVEDKGEYLVGDCSLRRRRKGEVKKQYVQSVCKRHSRERGQHIPSGKRHRNTVEGRIYQKMYSCWS